jgi:hypothetical protein
LSTLTNTTSLKNAEIAEKISGLKVISTEIADNTARKKA